MIHNQNVMIAIMAIINALKMALAPNVDATATTHLPNVVAEAFTSFVAPVLHFVQLFFGPSVVSQNIPATSEHFFSLR